MLDVRFVLYGTIADKLLHKVTSHWSCSLYIDYILVVDIGWYLLIDVYCSCWSNRFLILVPVLVRCSGPCRCGTSWHARFVSHSTIQGRGLGVAPQLFGSFVADFMTCFILFLCGFYMSIHHVFLDFACAVVCEKLLRLLAIQALNLWGFAFHVTGLRPQSGAPSKVCGTWKADESRIEFDSTLSHFGVTRAHWLVEEALFLLQEVYSLAICIIYIYIFVDSTCFAILDVACLDIRSIPKVLLQLLQRKVARVQLRLTQTNVDLQCDEWHFTQEKVQEHRRGSAWRNGEQRESNGEQRISIYSRTGDAIWGLILIHFGESLLWWPVLICCFELADLFASCGPRQYFGLGGWERLWKAIAVVLIGTDRLSWCLNWHLYLERYWNINADLEHPWRKSHCTPLKQFHMYPSKIDHIRRALRSWVSRRRMAQDGAGWLVDTNLKLQWGNQK